jgi:hypothetical protein
MRKEEKGALWLKDTMAAFGEHCPNPLLEILRARARTGDVQVYEVVTLYGHAAERRMLAEGKPLPEPSDERQEISYTFPEPRGALAGLEIWGRTNLYELFVQRIDQPLLALERVDVHGLAGKTLAKWAQFAEDVDGLFAEARKLIEAGRIFFTDENMAQFDHVGAAPHVLDAYRRHRWSNQSYRWRKPPRR